jgi:hypothetical protein
MTKKHYIRIAEIIANAKLPPAAQEQMIQDFVLVFAEDNKAFDRERFVAACRA